MKLVDAGNVAEVLAFNVLKIPPPPLILPSVFGPL
jgi:hypothetical protein